ncbi:hypothetical protein CAPI_07125 [Corynebacterium capitovis DSM 44611]|uniref:lycopene cyclase domain-containing protein n=1 Tax=Corynebacterium capitovis TaxID=131081 RepID=UPI0003626F9B|nr:lycopene cyclase domain-containing protein [Corynebacterium capitovis]WKD57965.1 hypothetical protein CAPI_07125 [Corynebacterium capitovis DSM 44611]
MTYLLISIPFLLFAVVLSLSRRARPNHLAVTVSVTAMICVLTVIFDNLMVAAGLVEYHSGNNTGVRIGLIPVEDLFYSVVVSLAVTALWPVKGDQP